MPKRRPRALDLFCGAGGSSCGARMAGISTVGGVDAWAPAIETFKLNHPRARTWQQPIETVSPRELGKAIGEIELLLASPECTNHTHAKGNRRVGDEQDRSRRTADEVVRFAKALRPRYFVVENVVSMRNWERYPAWKAELAEIGYKLCEKVLDSQDFGVPQARRRLFIAGDLIAPPVLPSPEFVNRATVKKILHKRGTNGFSYQMSPVLQLSRPRAQDTLDRINRAIDTLGSETPFLVVYYGSDAAGGWQRIDRPLRTITTLDRFALVKPTKDGHVMRMLQPPELAAAMGFPDDYCWANVSRRERIKLVGNAVCPPVMKAVVSALLRMRPAVR